MKAKTITKVNDVVNSLSLCYDKISEVIRDESDRGDPYGDSKITPEAAYLNGENLGRLTRARDLISELMDVLLSVY